MKNPKLNHQVPINHPLADSISVQNSSFHYANDECSELAFFKNGEFVLEIIPEFKGYEVDNFGSDTLVYSLVPDELVEKFLDQYRAQIVWKK